MTELRPPVYAEGRALLLVGLRQHHPQATAAQSILEQWEAFEALKRMPGAIGTTTYGVVCGNNPAEQTFEYMCGLEVADFDAVPADLDRMQIQSQRYAVFTHRGKVAKLRNTWAEIWNEWLPASGYAAADAPDFELYDYRFDRQAGKGVIEIWFPVMPEYDQNITKTLPQLLNL
ncbi:AraC family transcriptional regulator [filamentous cyanobacterium LEGE 11480]|uniref:AraC family transcriptional regulator n=1 Tax=Romeriopsis navalis LEGE 11480 TaxID=2777977 RepID=A0A928VTP9_9CYAN|nr:GyrI-like domain-containing protein [Romeriopsis navalis]MBE9031884.1 AraC family transcriptional regulator [Romeriopsis navalis LEGE 11480]